MKRGTTEHPKFLDLMAQLSIPKYSAIGVLEALWHFTAQYAQQGDVGRFNNAAIARAIQWDNGADELIQALVDCHWLDADPAHRLVVHGWYEHADEYLHNRLARAHLFFVGGHQPRCTRLPSRERELIEQFYRENAQQAPGERPEHVPNTLGERSEHVLNTLDERSANVPPVPVPVPVPVPDNKNLSSADADAGSVPKAEEPKSEFDAELDEVVRAMHDRHPAPRRCGPAIIRKSLTTIARESPVGERIAVINAIDKRHAGWCASDAWTKDGGEYARSLERWLAPSMKRYLDDPPAPAKPKASSMEFGKGLFQ